MDWEKLLAKEITPPFIPPVKDKSDISMIDPMFTREKVTLEDITQPTEVLSFLHSRDCFLD